MPFADFMRLALYCPKFGYYEQAPGRIGRAGDFYTSTTTGSLFGELVAFQCAEWLEELSGGPVQLVEAGAHEGQLAVDILGWFRQHRPELFRSLEYWIIEPSSNRQAWQRARLEEFADHIRWLDALPSPSPPKGLRAEPPRETNPPVAGVRGEAVHSTSESSKIMERRRSTSPIRGVIFSNELLDAMPVHRLGWDGGTWFEWGVRLCDEQREAAANPSFVWEKLPRAHGHLDEALRRAGFQFSPELLAVLPRGFTLELCPEAADWWTQAATALSEGKLMTIDYGFSAEEFVRPERTHGTLRAYHAHHLSSDLLAQPGEQDLTAHVNFTQIQNTGKRAGLETCAVETQERFFTKIAARIAQKPHTFAEWTPSRLRQFQTLIHPERLGRPFRVLVQSSPKQLQECLSTM